METAYGVAYRAEVSAAGAITGVASTIGTVDRSKRVFLPGAFGYKPMKVPMLAYHADDHPVGVSELTPASAREERIGATMRHSSRLSDIAGASDMRTLIRDGALPATSIGWHSDEDYWGWVALERANPRLAAKAKALGIPQSEDIHYFAKVTPMENSLTPVPANQHALIDAARAARNDQERAVWYDMARLAGVDLEHAAGARHNSSDQAYIQTAHDAMAALGAVCGPPPPGSNELSGGDYEPNVGDNGLQGVTGGWMRFMRTPYGSALVAGDVDSLAALLRARMGPDAISRGDWTAAARELAEYLAAEFVAAPMTTQSINDLPDEDFAYIEPGGKKDAEGKTTPRSLRHFPIHDAEHVRNALARLSSSPFGPKARPKVLAAAAKFGIKVSGDGSSALEDALHAEMDAMERQLAEDRGEITTDAGIVELEQTLLVGMVRDGDNGDPIGEMERALAEFRS